jgi:ribosome-binding factor A
MSANQTNARRTQRMASLLRGELARLFLQEVSDPIVQDLVITEVELSRDLKVADIFFTRPEGAPLLKAPELRRALQRVAPFLKKRLADELELRYVPELRFEEDRHGDELNRLLKIMDEVSHHP